MRTPTPSSFSGPPSPKLKENSGQPLTGLKAVDDVIGAEGVEIGAGERGAVESGRSEQELQELAAIAAVTMQQGRRRRLHGGGRAAAVVERGGRSDGTFQKEKFDERERESGGGGSTVRSRRVGSNHPRVPQKAQASASFDSANQRAGKKDKPRDAITCGRTNLSTLVGKLTD